MTQVCPFIVVALAKVGSNPPVAFHRLLFYSDGSHQHLKEAH